MDPSARALVESSGGEPPTTIQGVDFLIRNGCSRKFRSSAVANEKVWMEAHSLHSTFATSRELVNNETLLYPGVFFQTVAVSQITDTLAVCMQHKVDCTNPKKEKKRGVRKRFAKVIVYSRKMTVCRDI